MSYLRGFLPWICFAVIPDWRWAALVALALTIVQLRTVTRDHGSLGDNLLEVVSAGFFAVITVIAFAVPHSPFHSYVGAAASAVLALMAWCGLAVHRPFTLAIARREVPEASWHSPIFYRTNAVITTVWASVFTVSAIAQTLLHANHVNKGVSTVVQIAGFVLPMLFTRRYAATVRARAARSEAEYGMNPTTD